MKSSTKSKIVGVDDVMTQVVCTRYFLEAQDYNIHKNIVYKDNRSAVKMDKSRRWSSIKWTRYISIRDYFITN